MFINFSNPVKASMHKSTLVVAFRKSTPPLVWKFDLERNHSFSIALQGEDDDLELGLTSPKGEFFQIARFATRDDAEEAFLEVQKALLAKRGGWIRRVLVWVGGLVVLILLLRLISSYFMLHNLMNAVSSATTTTPEIITDGVALPADKVLRPPP